jgi:hypothetical protein
VYLSKSKAQNNFVAHLEDAYGKLSPCKTEKISKSGDFYDTKFYEKYESKSTSLNS